ncbi:MULTISPECIES: glycosyltransferase family 2 protein [unclassified Flavobacterium]|uniref:glycosyltransferase family 2 protein n=1 Tax=unclassified Flavobacterium TaxID=196869 RepID=UPI00131C2E8A|nr:glycosyltransferase family 2 protein [Flavobacterium sp. I-STPP5a]
MTKKLSIITINYNDKLGLQKTINSVINQSWQDFEYLVIDGGSNDGSAALIQDNKRIDYSISEKDSGVYDAMNKGIKVAKGEYLLFLNSGDFLVNETVLSQVFNKLDGKASIYYGNLFYSNKGKRTLLWTPPAELSFSYFLNNSLPHPASFIKKDLFFKYFLYNESLKIISDWEFFIYCICKMNEKYQHLDIVISDFDDSGLSSRKENLQKITVEKQEVLKNIFPLFYQDTKMIQEFQSKRVKHFMYLKSNKLKWKLLKGFMNLLLISESKKQIGTVNNYTKI